LFNASSTNWSNKLIGNFPINQIGKLSNVLIKEIPVLEQPGAWEEIVRGKRLCELSK
jgi:hypothetical protein